MQHKNLSVTYIQSIENTVGCSTHRLAKLLCVVEAHQDDTWASEQRVISVIVRLGL